MNHKTDDTPSPRGVPHLDEPGAGELTSTQLAERLGIHVNTLYGYERELGIKPRIGSKRRKYYDTEAIAVLEAVKALRDTDAGFSTIRRRLSVSIAPEPTGEGVAHAVDNSLDNTEAPNQPDTPPRGNAVNHSEDTGSINGLVELVAKLTEEKDQLHRELRDKEGLLATFRERNDVLSERVKLLEAPKPPRPWWRFW